MRETACRPRTRPAHPRRLCEMYIYIYIYIHIYMYIYICIRPAIFLFFFILQCFFIINFFSLNPKMLRLICDDSNLECFFKESVAYEMTFPIR